MTLFLSLGKKIILVRSFEQQIKNVANDKMKRKVETVETGGSGNTSTEPP